MPNFDPVMTGFELPKTMSPAGQLRAFQGVREGYSPPMLTSGGNGEEWWMPAAPPGGGEPPIAEAGIGALAALPRLAGPIMRGARMAAPYITGAVAGMGLGGLFGGAEEGGEVGPAAGGQPPVALGGPGLAEPSATQLIREWHISYPKGRAQYYLVKAWSGRKYIMMYKTWDGTWSWWPWSTPRLAVIGKNMPSHKMLTRLKRNLSRHTADARTILKVASPASYAKMAGYRKYGRRRR